MSGSSEQILTRAFKKEGNMGAESLVDKYETNIAMNMTLAVVGSEGRLRKKQSKRKIGIKELWIGCINKIYDTHLLPKRLGSMCFREEKALK